MTEDAVAYRIERRRWFETTRGAVRFPRAVKAILREAPATRDRRDARLISP